MIVGHKCSEVATARGEFGGFLPAKCVQWALPLPGATSHPVTQMSYQSVQELSRCCYTGLLTVIRKSHPGFWAIPHCHVKDPGWYAQDQFGLTVDGLMFLTCCLSWTSAVACGKLPLAAAQAYVRPAAATLPHKQQKQQ